jgi:hypothetical protein
MGGGGKGSQKVTIGYKYYATVHMVLCHAETAIKRILVGDKEVWSGSITSGSLSISKSSLFGGDNGEGGISGSLDVESGSKTQGINAYLSNAMQRTIPAYRGVVSVILKDFMLCSMNPYPKPWRFQVSRIPYVVLGTGDPSIAGYAANPAQIIAECLVNESWGLGIDQSELDLVSFGNAHNTLMNERFGLCSRWDQKQSIEDFISEICQIIDAQLQMDPTSGKYALKLIRQDYNVDSLMTLGPADIIKLSDYSRPNPTELINEVTVVFEDYKTGVEQSITEKNTAALALNPAINSTELRYQAVPTQELARRIALRELAQYASGLARCTLEVKRKAATLKMGDCFVLNWPPLGIDSMVMRVTHMSQGSSTDWMVRLECLQDVNSIPETSFPEPEPGWTPPSHEPVPIDNAILYEAPYFLVSIHLTYDSEAQVNDLPPGFGFFAACAVQPGGTTMGFKINTIDSYGQWTEDAVAPFMDYANLSANIDDIQTNIPINPGDMDDVDLNQPILIDEEWMLLTAMTSSSLTVLRGCLDTVPVPHQAPAVVWLIGYSDNLNASRVYVSGQQVQTKLQPYSSTGEIALASCPTRILNMNNRASRPIAPANICVNSIYRPKTLTDFATSLTWTRRDRLNTAKVYGNAEGDFLPEVGTTYTVVIKEKIFPNSAWTNGSTTNDIDGTSLELEEKYTPNAFALEFTCSSKKDELTSFQSNVVSFEHTPWVPELKSLTITIPPSGAGVTRGDMFFIPTGATGVWASQVGKLANYGPSGWVYFTPETGQKAILSGTTYEFNGTDWEIVT